MVTATPDVKLRPGVTVAIHSLKGAADLNGKEGTVEQWDADKGRWTVKLPGGERKALKPENLQPKGEALPLPPWAFGVIGLLGVLIAVTTQQSEAFGGAGTANYVKSLFEEFDPPPPQAPKDTVVISFCQG